MALYIAAGMLTGFLVTIVWYYPLHDVLYELVPASLFLAVALVVVSLVTGGKSRLQ